MLVALAKQLGWQIPATFEEEFTSTGGSLDLRFELQLTPDLAEFIAGYEHVCFVDAHTGNIPDEIRVVEVKGEYQHSPFTHHMTPATCLAMAQSLYGGNPQAILISVRGYEFGFEQALSARAQDLTEQAAGKINAWINDNKLIDIAG